MPTRPALRSTPSSEPLSANSSLSEEAVKAIAITSNPSRQFSRTQSPTTIHW